MRSLQTKNPQLAPTNQGSQIEKYISVAATSLTFSQPGVFGLPRKNGVYLYSPWEVSAIPAKGNISIPLVIDTEFVSTPVHWKSGKPQSRLPITTQVKGIYETAGVIFTHPEVADRIDRHPVLKHGFDPVDYLEHLGYQVTLERPEKMPSDLPVAEFVLYAHFALAEAMIVTKGIYRDDFNRLMAEKSSKRPRFEMTRRLRAVTPGNRGESDSVALPWVLTIDGTQYGVSVAWMDTGALHGQASYKEVCEAAGVTLDAKDNFTSSEKSRMLDMAINRPQEFDDYALGDLEVYQVLVKNADNFQAIYSSLGLSDYYKPPKLTIGATVRDLFLAALMKRLGIAASQTKEINQVVSDYLEPVSAGCLRKNPGETKSLLAKVEGGRCRNNRPLDTVINQGLGAAETVENPLVDLDISGCYGEGQRNQLYFVGKPEFISYPATSKVNDYKTLRDFINEFGKELVPGGWFARVSTIEPLEYPQDFFASWFVEGKAGEDMLAKYVSEMPSDTDLEAADTKDFNEEDGRLKIFNHEILNGTLTQDGLEWIMYVASEKQRRELLDKLVIKSAVFYSKSKQVDSWEQFQDSHKNHSRKNKVTRKGKGKNARNLFEDGECHVWLGFNIGELLIDELIANRKLYPKKTPMNTLFKLCINTLYGDMTSKFFSSANVVVGNNITARARALAWYMEKGLYGFQTITDGCAFELNRVLYPVGDRRVTGTSTVNLYRETDRLWKSHLSLKPLADFDSIRLQWVDKKPMLHLTANGETRVLEDSQAMNWVNQESMRHLQKVFSKVAVLHSESTSLKPSKDSNGKAVKNYVPRVGQFEFEAKDFYNSGVFHGTGNYCLENPKSNNLKMRAYETKKSHESVAENLEITDRYGDSRNPASDFLGQLSSPENLTRQPGFVKQGIIKPGDYKNRLKTWESLGLVPGDNFYKPGLLREFSLSQFTFQNLEQYKLWERAYTRAKDKTGQSIEMFFLDSEGKLEYQRMIETVDRLIVQGSKNPFNALDPHSNLSRSVDHPYWAVYQQLKELLNTPDRLED